MSEEKADVWGIIDLFGHVKIAGQIGEYALGGESFVRVDIPAVGDAPAHTRLFGKGAIYSISLTGREIAEAAARRLKSTPVSIFNFDEETRSRMRALPHNPATASVSQADDDDDGLMYDPTHPDNDY